ncbi:hypothetical protein [Sphingobacterium sp. Mn56C]|uniref:hypothetical protein n=1 Tax=Sphingobacterium sp. Mn56C TaxID=3395261 RepID=UPI003BF5BFED
MEKEPSKKSKIKIKTAKTGSTLAAEGSYGGKTTTSRLPVKPYIVGYFERTAYIQKLNSEPSYNTL